MYEISKVAPFCFLLHILWFMSLKILQFLINFQLCQFRLVSHNLWFGSICPVVCHASFTGAKGLTRPTTNLSFNNRFLLGPSCGLSLWVVAGQPQLSYAMIDWWSSGWTDINMGIIVVEIANCIRHKLQMYLFLFWSRQFVCANRGGVR